MNISRRSALMGASAAVAVAGVPGSVQADPVIGLVDELNHARRVWFAAADAGDQKGVRHWRRRYWNLVDQACETPAIAVRGVLAKLRGFYNEGEITVLRRGGAPGDDLDKYWAASIYRDLERLAGEARS